MYIPQINSANRNVYSCIKDLALYFSKKPLFLCHFFRIIFKCPFRGRGRRGSRVCAGASGANLAFAYYCLMRITSLRGRIGRGSSVCVLLPDADHEFARARRIPYIKTAAALEALRELILPYIGIVRTKSHFSFTRRPTPLPSLPITMAIGPVRFAS